MMFRSRQKAFEEEQSDIRLADMARIGHTHQAIKKFVRSHDIETTLTAVLNHMDAVEFDAGRIAKISIAINRIAEARIDP